MEEYRLLRQKKDGKRKVYGYSKILYSKKNNSRIFFADEDFISVSWNGFAPKGTEKIINEYDISDTKVNLKISEIVTLIKKEYEIKNPEDLRFSYHLKDNKLHLAYLMDDEYFDYYRLLKNEHLEKMLLTVYEIFNSLI